MTRYIKIIFTFSLLLNVLLIGVVGAGMYKRYQATDFSQSRIADNPNIKNVVKKAVIENRSQARANMKEMRSRLSALKDVIEAKDFDRAAYDAQVSKILSGRNDMAKIKAKAMGDALSDLSYEERQEFSRHALKSLIGQRKGQRAKRDVTR